MELTEVGRPQRIADVRAASVRALVPAGVAVLDERTTVAARSTATQLRVQGVQRLTVDPPERQIAEHGPDVAADELLVSGACGVLDVEYLEVPMEQLIDGRAGARTALLVDLGQKARKHLVGFLRGARARRHVLRPVVPLLRDGVDADVHPDAERAARTLLDLAAGAATSLGHGSEASRLAPQIAPSTPVDLLQ